MSDFENVFKGWTFDIFMEACYLAVADGHNIQPPGNARHYSYTASQYQRSYPEIDWRHYRNEALNLSNLKGEAFRRYAAYIQSKSIGIHVTW